MPIQKKQLLYLLSVIVFLTLLTLSYRQTNPVDDGFYSAMSLVSGLFLLRNVSK